MVTLADYQGKYPNTKMTRDERGILEITLHTKGDSLHWGSEAHRSLPLAFRDVARDRENRVVLLTGAGDEFVSPRADRPSGQILQQHVGAGGSKPNVDFIMNEGIFNGVELTNALLDIPVPVVCAVNGPVRRHCEFAWLSDLTVASEDASFEDSAHFHLQSLIPGDSIQIIAPMVLGLNRARSFMLTGEAVSAQEALHLGVVKEVVAKDQVLERARHYARQIAEKPDATLRFTRTVLVHPIKAEMQKYLQMGFALSGLAFLAQQWG